MSSDSVSSSKQNPNQALPIQIREITIRHGNGGVMLADQINPNEVLVEPVIWVAGQLSGRLPPGCKLELVRVHRLKQVDEIPAEKGHFAATLRLRNGRNSFDFRIVNSNEEILSHKIFSLYYKSSFREWSETVIIAFFLAIIIRSLVIQAFWIPTGSMEPTLLGEKSEPDSRGNFVPSRSGDRILVSKFAYVADFSLDGRIPILPKITFALPNRGDIIVFKYPDKDPNAKPRDFIKRVVGLPGDHIQIKSGIVYVNGVGLKEDSYIKEPPLLDFETEVPLGNLFVMGDNRNNSADSRYWGPMPLTNLKGQATFLYWPLSRFGPIRSFSHPPILPNQIEDSIENKKSGSL